MKQFFFISCVLSFTLWLQGCSKGGAPYPNENPSPYVLDSMVYDVLTADRIYFSYRADKLQDKIVTDLLTIRDTVSFEYKGKQISRITSSRLPRTSEYVYNILGQITSITLNGLAGVDGHLRFDYGYNVSGKLKSLSYYTENESGKKLVYTCSYQYGTDGLLRVVTCEPPGGNSITYTIDAYSEECDFNPWAFIQPLDLNLGFEIYNLPLLQNMKKLPAKITRTGTGTQYIQHITASIQNKVINNLEIVNEYPDNRKNDMQYGIKLFYHK